MPVFLPGIFYRQRSLVGYSPWVIKSKIWLSMQAMQQKAVPSKDRNERPSLASASLHRPSCIFISEKVRKDFWLRHLYILFYQFWNLESDNNFMSSVQFSSVVQSCPTLCDGMNRSMPGLPFYHQLPEFTQTHVHRVSDAIQPSHPLSSPSPPATNPSQYQSIFQWVNSSHEVAKVLEFQL